MDITLNGKPHTCPAGTTLATLIQTLQLQDQRLAVEINLAIVPRSTYARHPLNPGDQIEIVHAIGGGSHSNTRTTA